MKKKRRGLAAVLALALGGLCAVQAAGGFSVSVSTTSVYLGDSFTVHIGGDVVGRFDLSASGGTLSATAVFIESPGAGASVTCTPTAAGTTTVTVRATDVSDSSYQEVTGSKQVKVSVAQKAAETPAGGGGSGGNSNGGSGGSSGGGSGGGSAKPSGGSKPAGGASTPAEEKPAVDLSLASLSFSQGELEPAFSPEQTSYTLRGLRADLQELSVKAVAAGENTTVDGAGDLPVSTGSPQLRVAVVGPQGEGRGEYVIDLKFIDEPVAQLAGPQGEALGVLNDLAVFPALEGYENTTVTAGEKALNAKTTGGRTLLYAQDAAGQRRYYLYDGGTLSSLYQPFFWGGRQFVALSFPAEIAGRSWLTPAAAEIGGANLEGLAFTDEALANYLLFYLEDAEGQAGLYQYDRQLGTLQHYPDTVPLSQEDYERQLHSRETAIWLLAAGCVFLAGAAAFLGVRDWRARGGKKL